MAAHDNWITRRRCIHLLQTNGVAIPYPIELHSRKSTADETVKAFPKGSDFENAERVLENRVWPLF